MTELEDISVIRFLIAGLVILLPLFLHGQSVQEAWSTYCETCHSCDNPTLDEPCLEVCPRHAGHFEGEHEVQEGPEVVILDQLERLYEPVPFAHKLHASMADMSGGCTFCHHYSEAAQKVPPCRECHEENRAAGDLRQPGLKGAYHRQCIGCHRDWSHETGCIACHEVKQEPVAEEQPADRSDILGIPHPRITAEKKYVYETLYEPAPVVTFHHGDHVDQFGLTCASCHQGDNCGRCHDLGHRVVTKIEHVKTCIACHREDNCAFCHDRQEKPPFDHAVVIGWPLEERHRGAACQDCHGATKSFRVPDTECFDCHDWDVDSFDHSAAGLTLNEDHEEVDCTECHVDESFDQPPTCDSCHDDIEFPAELPGRRVQQ